MYVKAMSRKKMFDHEGKTIAPPHVSNGPPLKAANSRSTNMVLMEQ